MTTSHDDIYRDARSAVEPFRFDDTVARVFPDMIRRSVPGYASIVEMTGVIAGLHAQPGTKLYDLGCSLGASTLAMRHRLLQRGLREQALRDVAIVAVDNSTAMLDRARLLLGSDIDAPQVDWRCEDIRDTVIADASFVACNFTLQFVPLADRAALLRRVHDGLRPGGAFVLSEKIRFADAVEQRVNDELHLEFKRAQGYSELEIAQKRSALENVLVPETLDDHVCRLRDAGFATVTAWFRCFNFVSIVAFRSA